MSREPMDFMDHIRVEHGAEQVTRCDAAISTRR